jgi:hypothetical protein
VTESLLKRGVPGIAQLLNATAPLRELGGLTETGYIEEGLTLANWPRLESDRAALAAGLRLMMSDEGVYLAPGYSPSSKDLAHLITATQPFIQNLDELAAHRSKGSRLAIAHRVIPLADRQICFPVFDFDPKDKRKGVAMELRCYPESLEAALAYIVALFLDNSRPYGRDLHRCKLDSCRRFYLVDRTAAKRPNTSYCCPEHGAEQNRLDSAERQRRSRAARKGRARQPRRAR